MTSDVLLDVRGLTVTYGGLRAVDDVELRIEAPSVLGVIGPNGAGKTTTIDALCGFVPGARGSILLAGQRLDGMAAHRRARAGLVRTFQSVELFDDLSVAENLLVAALSPRWWSPFVDAVAPNRSKRAATHAVHDALELVGLADLADAAPTSLSHGQRRLVGVARALAARPAVVLLDEPAAGLDPHETDAFGELVRRLPGAGVGVLLVDHDMTLVLDVCDRITVLDFGRVIAEGTPAAISADRNVIDAYLGGGA